MIGCFAATDSALHNPVLAAPNALIRQSKKDRSGKSHCDGWGIASWHGDPVPRIRKNYEPAFEDKLFAEYASSLRAPVWFAHVRAASSGNVRRENTHPFQHGSWAWVHNGTIIKPITILGDIIMDHVAPELRSLRTGETDTELCFLLFLTELRRRSAENVDHPAAESAAAALRTVIDFLITITAPHKQNPPTMNFMTSNGRLLLATRWGKTLWTLQSQRTSSEVGHTIYVASEPFDDDDWQEVPDHALLIVDEHRKMQVVALDD